MGRFGRTIEIAKTSWAVLQHDRELLILPVLGAAASLIVAGAMAVIFFVLAADGDVIGAVLIFVAITVISVFFKAAVVSGTWERFSGGDPTVKSALRASWNRIHVVLPWALVVATVGLVIRAIQSSKSWIADLIARVLALSWSVLSFLVLPIVVVEETGPIDSVYRSAELLRKTWGENLIAQVGFFILGLISMLPGVAVASAITAISVALGSGALAAAGATIGVVIGIVWVSLVAAALSTLMATFQTTLYFYAITGHVPSEFQNSGIATFFTERSTGRMIGGFD